MRNAQTFQRMETPHLWVGPRLLRMETPLLRQGDVPFTDGNAAFAGGMCLLRMETPLRGRSGGHIGTAPTISPMAPCPKVAGE